MQRGKLTNENIDRAIRELESFFEKKGADRAYILRTRLAVEEILLSWRDRFGEEKEFSMDTSGLLRVQRCELRVKGEEFDPSGDAGEHRILNGMLARNELVPRQDYLHGYNRVVCVYHRRITVSAALWMLIAAALAIVLGLLVKGRPDGVVTLICRDVIVPVSEAIMRLMSLFASFMIFWSIMSGVLGMGDVSTFNQVGRSVLRRFLLTSFALSTVALVFFLLNTPLSGRNGAAVDYGSVVTMLLDIIPGDPFSPFINGNTLQVIFLSLVLGITLLVLRSRVGNTALELIRDMGDVSDHVLSGVISLLPIVVFSSLFQLVCDNDPAVLADTLMLPLIYLILLAVLLAADVLLVCTVKRVSPLVLLRKLAPVMQIAATTASSGAAYMDTVRVCERELGVDPRLVKVGVSLGPSLYVPGAAILIEVIIFMAVRWYGLPFTASGIVSALIVPFLLAISSPPIPGGMTAVYLIVFSAFGIPGEMLAVVMALDALTDRIDTVFNQTGLMLRLVWTAGSQNMLDTERLRAPVRKAGRRG